MLKGLAVIAAAATVFGSAAHALPLDNYAQWRALSKTEKSLFVLGLVDGRCFVNKDFDQKAREYCEATINGKQRCLFDMDFLSGDLLSEIIDNAYAGNVTKRSVPPALVFEEEMESLCQSWLESSRKRPRAER